jgi:hypothetical protein
VGANWTGGSAPANGDTLTLVIGGVTYVYRWQTAPTLVNDIRIGASATVAATNLFKALTGGVLTPGAGNNEYVSGTTVLPKAAVTVAVPTGANLIALTAVATGTAANSWTLARTGTALTLSAANFAGGVNGETATIIIQSATTSGGSFSTFATFTANGQVRLAERLIIAAGVTINRWIRVTNTMSGSANIIGFNVAFARNAF